MLLDKGTYHFYLDDVDLIPHTLPFGAHLLIANARDLIGPLYEQDMCLLIVHGASEKWPK